MSLFLRYSFPLKLKQYLKQWPQDFAIEYSIHFVMSFSFEIFYLNAPLRQKSSSQLQTRKYYYDNCDEVAFKFRKIPWGGCTIVTIGLQMSMCCLCGCYSDSIAKEGPRRGITSLLFAAFRLVSRLCDFSNSYQPKGSPWTIREPGYHLALSMHQFNAVTSPHTRRRRHRFQ